MTQLVASEVQEVSAGLQGSDGESVRPLILNARWSIDQPNSGLDVLRAWMNGLRTNGSIMPVFGLKRLIALCSIHQ